MLKKKYYDGMQIQSIITEELNNGELIMQILKRFADEPSADVRENVKGKWGNSGEYPWDKCSVCGHCVNPYEDDYFFCPNCGADMRGEGHE